MKVFISWSGEPSRVAANALRDWLPNVIQVVDPWMSAADIDAGARWSREVEGELEASRFGIFCITPENVNSPWIHFEAGAIAKTVDESRVCPLLFDITPGDIPAGPLTLFQAKRATREGVREITMSLNQSLGERRLTEGQLSRAFDRWWPDLESRFAELPEGTGEPAQRRSTEDMVEEILTTVRTIARTSHQSAYLEFFDVTPPAEALEREGLLRELAAKAEPVALELLEDESNRIESLRVVPSPDGFMVMLKEAEGAQAVANVDFDPSEIDESSRMAAATAEIMNAAKGIVREVLSDRRYYASEEGREALRDATTDEGEHGNDR